MFQDNLLSGQRILITGGGSGIGFEIAKRYVSLGARVVICGRRPNVLEKACTSLNQQYGDLVKGYALDIRKPCQIESVLDSIEQDGQGSLTGLVNNAAGNFICKSEQLTPNGFDTITNIVLHGTFYMTQAVAKRWLTTQQSGSIINILVTWIWHGGPFTVPSAAAKAAVANMTKSLSVEWGSRGIRINAIAPGPFPTDGATQRLQPKAVSQALSRAGVAPNPLANPANRHGIMDELTHLAVFLMAKGIDYLTGQVIAIDGGAHLTNGGNFYYLGALDDQDWQAVRKEIDHSHQTDKAQRHE